MDKNSFPKRQVHLDFHTSKHIPKIGDKFNKEQFQSALKKGNVESITVFAKCHNSMCYYPTKIGTMHPNLDFDLTGALVDAAHEIGVRAPIYITAGWSEEEAMEHPEWLMKDEDGSLRRSPELEESLKLPPDAPRGMAKWSFLCLNDGNEYTKEIYELTEEICKRYKNIDGLFYDICCLCDTCYCDSCKKGMNDMGLDPYNIEDNRKYFILKHKAFMDKCREIMVKYHPDATIFFNSGGADEYRPDYHDNQTHYEMEDLPTAWGGYDKLPIRAKFFDKTGKPFIGMTGKFHLDWGEFGGFKCGDALKYEIASMAMYGAGCSIGDHMHPSGEMEMQTYENIGVAYNYLEKIAPFCYGGSTTAMVGLFLADKPNRGGNEGISNILLENQIDYDIVYNNNFADFDTVIIPDTVVLGKNSLLSLKDYIKNGGKVLFMGDGLVKDGKFQIDCGAEYISVGEFDCDYISTDNETAEKFGLPKAPMLCNFKGHKIRLTDGDVLAEITVPYFSRTMAHYCGHKNTPHNPNAEKLPAIVKKGNVVYMAHPMGKIYKEYGSLYQKRYLIMALSALAPKTCFKIEGLGAEGRATMIKQEDKNRYCLNMTYASPVKRGKAEIIEDIPDVFGIKISLDVPKKIKRAYLGVTGEELNITEEDGKQTVTVPKLNCHASVAFEY